MPDRIDSSHAAGPVLEIPELSLVLLIGACGSGRRAFAAQHFPATASLEAGLCPDGMPRPAPAAPQSVSFELGIDEEDRLPATGAAPGASSEHAPPDQGFFPPEIVALHRQVRKRLATGRQTFVIAPTLHPWQRRPLLEIAKRAYTQVIAVIFDLPEDLIQQRNQARATAQAFPADDIHQQIITLHQSLSGIQREGFTQVHILHTQPQVEAAQVRLRPMPSNFKTLTGPFDIIGDVHGCADELEELLERLGYQRVPVESSSPAPRLDQAYPWRYQPPQGRQAVFVGDLVDRGPRILHACDIARNMQSAGGALCVPGNHDDKFMRMLKGRRVKIENGLETSLAALQALPAAQRPVYERALLAFFERLPHHLVLDRGQLVVAHAGIKAAMIGRDVPRVRDFTLFGETTGETDAYGLPVRLNWAEHYHDRSRIIYGHTPQARPVWQNNTLNIDTGCVFGGRLTALRYPEMELVSVPARQVYAQAKRPFLEPE